MRRVRRVTLVSAMLVGALMLAGCVGNSVPAATPTVSSYSSAAASRLQSAVLSVSSAAANGDPAAALARLDELTVTLADARARGEVSTARLDSISAAMALVRADLQSAITAQNDVKPGKTEDPGKGNRDNGD